MERRLDYAGSAPEDPVAEAAQQLRGELELDCSGFSWKRLYVSPGDAMYEWQHDGCLGGDSEHELLRLLHGTLAFPDRVGLSAEPGVGPGKQETGLVALRVLLHGLLQDRARDLVGGPSPLRPAHGVIGVAF